MTFKCARCGEPLYLDEWDDDVCGVCADNLYENNRFRDEWNHYHDEPCPDSELPHPTGEKEDAEESA